MPWKNPKKQCPYNEWVYCRDTTCAGCGWYPKEDPEQEHEEREKEE